MTDRTPRQIIGDDAYMQLVFEGYEVIAADTLASKDTALAEAKKLSDRWEEGFKHLERLCAEWKARADETASELQVANERRAAAESALAEMRVELAEAKQDAILSQAQTLRELERWAEQANKEDECRQMWQARAESAEADLARARKALEEIVDTVPKQKRPHLPIIAEILDIASRSLGPLLDGKS